jgi:hypothetical protein
MGRVNGQNISIGIIANQGIYSPPLYVLRKERAEIEKVDFFPRLHTCTYSIKTAAAPSST